MTATLVQQVAKNKDRHATQRAELLHPLREIPLDRCEDSACHRGERLTSLPVYHSPIILYSNWGSQNGGYESNNFWDVTRCIVNRCFGGTYHLHLQNRSINRAESAGLLFATSFHVGFLLDSLFYPEDVGDMFFRNASWLSMDDIALFSAV
jgi:hypothetical protein